jgi:hypothetical protein
MKNQLEKSVIFVAILYGVIGSILAILLIPLIFEGEPSEGMAKTLAVFAALYILIQVWLFAGLASVIAILSQSNRGYITWRMYTAQSGMGAVQPSGTVICPNCSQPNKTDAAFCTRCGTPVTRSQPSGSSPP